MFKKLIGWYLKRGAKDREGGHLPWSHIPKNEAPVEYPTLEYLSSPSIAKVCELCSSHGLECTSTQHSIFTSSEAHPLCVIPNPTPCLLFLPKSHTAVTPHPLRIFRNSPYRTLKESPDFSSAGCAHPKGLHDTPLEGLAHGRTE